MIFYELINKLNYDQIVCVKDKGERVVCDDACKVAHFSRKLALSEVKHIYTVYGNEKVILMVEV